MSDLKLSFFQRRRNLTGHNFLVLSNFWSDNYFDSFDEADNYALRIRHDLLNYVKNDPNAYCRGQGYTIYGWDKKKWHMIAKWVY